MPLRDAGDDDPKPSATARPALVAPAPELCDCQIRGSPSVIAALARLVTGDVAPVLQAKDVEKMKEWESYFVLTGTGAVTLMGLLFIVVTLGAQRSAQGDEQLLRTFLTPTLFHFGVVFLIALLTLSPEADSLILPFGLIGLAGLVYSAGIAVKTARRHRVFSVTWLFHGGIPLVCYAGVVTAAWLGVTSTRQAYLVFRAVSALLLLIGMRNAWAAAVGIARRELN